MAQWQRQRDDHDCFIMTFAPDHVLYFLAYYAFYYVAHLCYLYWFGLHYLDQFYFNYILLPRERQKDSAAVSVRSDDDNDGGSRGVEQGSRCDGL